MPLSSKKQRQILKLTPDWIQGKITVYQVSKQVNIEFNTAKKYLERFKLAINEQTQIVERRILEAEYTKAHPKKTSWIKRILLLFMRNQINEQKEPIRTESG